MSIDKFNFRVGSKMYLELGFVIIMNLVGISFSVSKLKVRSVNGFWVKFI